VVLKAYAEKKIGVLMGGMSVEREISIKSGEAISFSLDRLGYRQKAIDVDPDVALTLRREGIEVAFIALHGRYGEDGTIQGLLDVMQIPYTGSGVLASAMGMDKIASRQIFLSQGLSVPPYLVLHKEAQSSFNSDQLPFGFPVVVKPVSEGSSVGVTIVPEPKGLAEGLKQAFRHGPRILIEKFISGKEVHVGILGERTLGAIEIKPKTEFYDYTAKYVAGMSEHLYPAPLSSDLYEKVLASGLRAHRALGCSGYSRVDFLIDVEENLYLLEVNTLPGMTETSLMPEMARGVGVAFDALVEEILATASTG